MSAQDIETIQEGGYLSKVDKYFNSFYTAQNTLIDYLDDDFIILVDEYSKVM